MQHESPAGIPAQADAYDALVARVRVVVAGNTDDGNEDEATAAIARMIAAGCALNGDDA